MKSINEMLQNAKGYLRARNSMDESAPDVDSAIREIDEALAAMVETKKMLQTLNEVSEDAFNAF